MLAMFYLILKRLRGVTFGLLSHKGRCYHQQQPTWSQPLDWVFVVLFICVRGSPFSHFHILRCYFHIATPLWCDTKAAAIRRLGQSHLIGSLLYFSSVLEVSHQVLEMFYLMFKCLLSDYFNTNAVADWVSPT